MAETIDFETYKDKNREDQQSDDITTDPIRKRSIRKNCAILSLFRYYHR